MLGPEAGTVFATLCELPWKPGKVGEGESAFALKVCPYRQVLLFFSLPWDYLS